MLTSLSFLLNYSYPSYLSHIPTSLLYTSVIRPFVLATRRLQTPYVSRCLCPTLARENRPPLIPPTATSRKNIQV
ncbi:hypothetical protein Pmani_023120 [Petrolisthes manimaculis]|uniref:Uncharacterized protein n=1 Tax=Petrolisthes manimaculis TaxID=1843537 RepID=A0AAE1PCL7_9EUCA|nr:hypothetical protein Pmani_023120 [Petrolisthes manimaculis]